MKLLLEKQPGNLIICGDFNIVLEDQDIHDPQGQENHIMVSELERQAFRAILEPGFADAFRSAPQRRSTLAGGAIALGPYRGIKTGGLIVFSPPLLSTSGRLPVP